MEEEEAEMERLGDVVGPAAAIWSDLTTDAGDKRGLAHPASQEKFKGGAGRGGAVGVTRVKPDWPMRSKAEEKYSLSCPK